MYNCDMSSLSNDYLEKEMILKFTNQYLENLDDDIKKISEWDYEVHCMDTLRSNVIV